MNRSTLDKLISSTGLIIGVVLLAASLVLCYAHRFVHTQVRNQLAAQKIEFPAPNSASITSLPLADSLAMSKYAGQQLTTGAQAEVFADHFIAVHLDKVGGGKTYAELSAASIANPTDTKLVGQVQTVFRGETLRGLLLNAYAFDTMAMVANMAALGAAAAGALLVVLAGLGFYHSSRVKNKKR
ncbi:MAG TPA: hypothetical protein VLH84_02710 [Patescibacteria group bacterium]|nr:hypothetical protein [Patescibacteria group bacterium]